MVTMYISGNTVALIYILSYMTSCSVIMNICTVVSLI